MTRARVWECIACVGMLAGLAVLWKWEASKTPHSPAHEVTAETSLGADGSVLSVRRDAKTGEIESVGGMGVLSYAPAKEPVLCEPNYYRALMSIGSRSWAWEWVEDTAVMALGVGELEMSSDMTSAAQTFDSGQDGFLLVLRFPGLGVREYCWSGGAWHEEPQEERFDPHPIYVHVENVGNPALDELRWEWR